MTPEERIAAAGRWAWRNLYGTFIGTLDMDEWRAGLLAILGLPQDPPPPTIR